MPLGIQQNNDFTQFTMDVWNDKIFYQEKDHLVREELNGGIIIYIPDRKQVNHIFISGMALCISTVFSRS